MRAAPRAGLVLTGSEKETGLEFLRIMPTSPLRSSLYP